MTNSSSFSPVENKAGMTYFTATGSFTRLSDFQSNRPQAKSAQSQIGPKSNRPQIESQIDPKK